MKTISLTILTCLFSTIIFGQIGFKQVSPLPPEPINIGDFHEITRGAVAFADIDNDNDLDVIITGTDLSGNWAISTKLYINDGYGRYLLDQGTSFEDVHRGDVAFADVDNDNDQDLYITGSNNGAQPVANLYLNDGNGDFTLAANTPFVTIAYGSIAFADVDNDNDQDLFIVGSNQSNLYTNDGSGNFALVPATPFEQVSNSDIALADIDNDNDQDLLMTGNVGTQRVSKLYSNDGNGVFSLVPGTPFEGVYNGSVAFADIDNDNDQDVLIVGYTENWAVSELYINDGLGNFTEENFTPFSYQSQEVLVSATAMADMDNDGDQDIIISGQYVNSIYPSYVAAKVYLNNGNNNFSPVYETPMEGVQYGDVAFADIDNDNDQDLLINGEAWTSYPYPLKAKLYRNTHFQHCPVSSNFTFNDNGSGNFSFTNTSTGNVLQSHWAFGDGNTSLVANPIHTFNANGSHLVLLTTAIDSSFLGPACVDYSMQTVNVSGIQSPVQCYAGFVMYPDTGINNVTVINSSVGTNLTYLWDFGDGNTSTLQNPSHTYATAGPFYLCLTIDDSNGCIDQYCDSIGVNGVVFKTGGFTINVITPVVIGVDELNVIDVFSIYPNPTSTKLIIDTELEVERITIADITGKQIQSIFPNSKVLNVEDLSNGIYFIKIEGENQSIIRKFVKQ
jgi:PKD repeat protein